MSDEIRLIAGARTDPILRGSAGERAIRLAMHWPTLTRGVRLFRWQWLALWEEADRSGVNVSAIVREIVSTRFAPPLDEEGNP